MQRTLTNFANLLRVGEETQHTGSTGSLRPGEGDDPDADDDAEEESLPRRFLLRPVRRDRYVIFQPYTLLAILLGFVCKYVRETNLAYSSESYRACHSYVHSSYMFLVMSTSKEVLDPYCHPATLQSPFYIFCLVLRS